MRHLLLRLPRPFHAPRPTRPDRRRRARLVPDASPLEPRLLLAGEIWSQRGGDSGHSSYVDAAIDPASIAPDWTQTLSYVSSATGSWSERAVAIDGQRVYRTDLDGYAFNGAYHVMAYDLQTGTQLWNQVFYGNAFEGVGEPSVSNGIVYVNRAGHSGISGGTSADLPRLYGLDAATGNVVLQTTYGAQWSSNERPAIAGNQLVAWDGYYGGFSSWNTSTLARQWNNSGSIYDKPMAAMDASNVYAYGNLVYSRATGARLPDMTHPSGMTLSDPQVAPSGKLLYKLSGYSGSVATYGVAAYDGATRSLLWTYPTANLVTAKAAGDGMVAVVVGSQLTILDEASGATIRTWTSPNPLNSELILTRTHAFVQAYESGSTRVTAVNLATGAVDWSFLNNVQGEDGGTYMEMALSGGHLVLSNDAFVKAFDLASADSPVDAIDDAAATSEDTVATIPVLANDVDADRDPLLIASLGKPLHGTVSIGVGGTVVYQPTANYFGQDEFTYTVSDGRGSTDVATVRVTITPVNDAPVATSWQYDTPEDVPLNGTLRGSDVEGSPLRFTVVATPGHGSLQVDGTTGGFRYVPQTDYFGTDQFRFKVDDGSLDSNIATVFITVAPVNDPPISRPDAYAIDEDTSLSTTATTGVLANDSEVDGGPLSAVLVSGPGKGYLTLRPDGSFDYVPLPNVFGTDSFTYKPNDGRIDGQPATVTLTIRPVQDPPIANAGPDARSSEGQALLFDASGSGDPDGDALSFTWNFGDGTVGTGAAPSHTYRDSGTYTATLAVSDGHGNTAYDSLSVVVADVGPVVAVAGPSSAVAGQSRTFTFAAVDVSPSDQAAPFVYTIDWGDGMVQQVSGGASLTLDHRYAGLGGFTIKASAADIDGLDGAQATSVVQVKAIELQGDALVVGGTTGRDSITIQPAGSTGDVSVTLNGASLGNYRPAGRILVYGQAGNDTIRVQSTKIKSTTYTVGISTIVDGGAGDDLIDAGGSSAPNVLVGGDGADTITNGSGRGILVGGMGADTLRGGGGDDVLIGGTTDFDANTTALIALLEEWKRTDLGYDDRADHLSGVTLGGRNGAYTLNARTIHTDLAVDQLYGGNGQDWFFYDSVGPTADRLNDRKSNERATKL